MNCCLTILISLLLHRHCAGSANSNYGSVSSTSCQLCTPGRFAALPGSAFCSDCGSGKYSTTAGQSTCALCPVGPCDNSDSYAHSSEGTTEGMSNSAETTFRLAPLCIVLASALCRTLRPAGSYSALTGRSDPASCINWSVKNAVYCNSSPKLASIGRALILLCFARWCFIS